MFQQFKKNRPGFQSVFIQKFKGMVGKKSGGLFWIVFALMIPKVGPMALGTFAGLVGI